MSIGILKEIRKQFMNFYERFNALLEENGISPLRLAKEIGVPKSIVYEWKNGIREPSADNLKKLSSYFGLSVSSVLGIDEPDKKEQEVLMLLRQTRSLSEKDHEILLDGFRQTLKLYLSARNGKNNDE